jgi:hypothetical protein
VTWTCGLELSEVSSDFLFSTLVVYLLDWNSWEKETEFGCTSISGPKGKFEMSALVGTSLTKTRKTT